MQQLAIKAGPDQKAHSSKGHRCLRSWVEDEV